MLTAFIALLVGTALGGWIQRRTEEPPELPPSRLICPRCERELHDHAPTCRHSPNRRRP
jgi:hypothetical protein